MKKLLLMYLLTVMPLFAQQRTIPIWPGLAPGTENRENHEEWRGKTNVKKVYQPDLAVFLPENVTTLTPAILVCPGGGYRNVVIEKEGYKIARWLNKNNIAAFVLKYRLDPDEALEDAQQAMRVIRTKADEFNVDADKIGIMGFSAGGHLSGNLATHYQIVTDGVVDSTSARPDFWIGVYGEYNSMSSQTGEKFFYERVHKNSPPVLLIHAANDSKVPVAFSVDMFTAYHQQGALAELHIYEQGKHGFALETNRSNEITSTVNNWSARLLEWLKVRGVIAY